MAHDFFWLSAKRPAGLIRARWYLFTILLTGCLAKPSSSPSPLVPAEAKQAPSSTIPLASIKTGEEMQLQQEDITIQQAPAVWQELVRKYAPIFYFHANEKYLPTGIPWFLRQVGLKFKHEELKIDQILIPPGKIDQDLTNLLSQEFYLAYKLNCQKNATSSKPKGCIKQNGRLLALSEYAEKKDRLQKQGFVFELVKSRADSTKEKNNNFHIFLGSQNDEHWHRARKGNWHIKVDPGQENETTSQKATCYSQPHLVQSNYQGKTVEYLDIPYSLFYGYNGYLEGNYSQAVWRAFNIAAHEGDWEHITIRLQIFPQQKEKLVGVYYSAHGQAEGLWQFVESSPSSTQEAYFQQVEGYKLRDRRPVAYSALYTHGMYNRIGEIPRRIGATGANWYERFAGKWILPYEYTGAGYELDCSQANRLAIISPTYADAQKQFPWFSFAGLWGSIPPDSQFGLANSGPSGLAFKSYTFASEANFESQFTEHCAKQKASC